MKNIDLINENYYYEDLYPFLNQIQEYGDQCRRLSNDTRFTNNDVRNTYYKQLKNVINSFYVAILSPFLMSKINIAAKMGRLTGLLTDKQAEHVNRLGMLCEADYVDTWVNIAKVEFVIGAWLCFEDAIDLIYTQVVDGEGKEKNKLQYYQPVEKLIKSEVTEETLLSVKEQLSTDYVTVSYKYNYILNHLKKENTTKKQLSDIRNFLTFFNLLRNASHYNSRPIKDFTAITPIGTFEFKKDAPIDFFDFDVLVGSMSQFIEIMEIIRTNLVYTDEITNPYKDI